MCGILTLKASIFRWSAATWDGWQLRQSGLGREPPAQTGRQAGRWGLGVSACVGVCVTRVSERAGSGCGHPSRVICGESVTPDHMVESVAPGQGQAKIFPQSELVRMTQTHTAGSVGSDTTWRNAVSVRHKNRPVYQNESQSDTLKQKCKNGLKKK